MSMRVSTTEPFRCIGRSISEFITNKHVGLSCKIISVAFHVFCGLGLFFALFYGFSISLTSSLVIAGGVSLTALFIQTVMIGYRIIKNHEQSLPLDYSRL